MAKMGETQTLKTSISVASPFSWTNTLAFLNRSTLHPIYRIENDRLHRLAASGPFLFHVVLGPAVPAGEGAQGGDFTIPVVAHPIGPPPAHTSGSRVTKRWLQDFARHIVSAEDDGEAIARALSHDRGLGTLLERCPGVRIVRMAGLYEALADAIIGQQISVAAAHTVRRRLMAALYPGGSPEAGSPPGNGEKGRRGRREPQESPGPELPQPMVPFPSARAVADAPKALLDACGLGRRGDYLQGVARLAADGELPRAQDLKSMELREAEAALTSIKGVGPWTAQSALMFGVGRNDVFPAADLGLREGMRLLYGLDRRPETREAAAAAGDWKDWGSYAAYYFWGARMLLEDGSPGTPGTG